MWYYRPTTEVQAQHQARTSCPGSINVSKDGNAGSGHCGMSWLYSRSSGTELRLDGSILGTYPRGPLGSQQKRRGGETGVKYNGHGEIFSSHIGLWPFRQLHVVDVDAAPNSNGKVTAVCIDVNE